MANRQRYRSGLTAPKVFKIQGGTAIVFNVSDLVFKSGNYVLPASHLVGTAGFETGFVGVFKTPATLGTETADQDCLVDTHGDYEFDLAAPATAGFPAGSPVGIEDLGGTSSQTVDILLDQAQPSIGHLAREVKPGDTTALVTIRSSVYEGKYVPA